MAQLELFLFDMAGTTVVDNGDVYNAFLKTVEECRIQATGDEVLEWMGRRKRDVFEHFLTRQLGADAPNLEEAIDEAYAHFRGCLEAHYRNEPVSAIGGAEALFASLRERGIKVALTTGFYRVVADIILGRLGWDRGLDGQYLGGDDSVIDASVCADDVPLGRPAPYMIHEAMRRLGVLDIHGVGNAGDTKVDLLSAYHAGCPINVGVLSGSYDEETLKQFPHTHIVASIADLPPIVDAFHGDS